MGFNLEDLTKAYVLGQEIGQSDSDDSLCDERKNIKVKGLSITELFHRQAKLGTNDMKVNRGDYISGRPINEMVSFKDYYSKEQIPEEIFLERLTIEESKILLFDWLTKIQKQFLMKEGSLNTKFVIINGEEIQRFRLNIYLASGGFNMSSRLVNSKPNSDITKTTIPKKFIKNIKDESEGVFIVAAPTNSGKTYTLATVLENINQTERVSMITIEEPIETFFQPKLSKIVQVEIGSDADAVGTASKSVLRQDQDVALIGETRYFNELEYLLKLGLNGHRAFTTLHTNSASETILYMLDLAPSDKKSQVMELVKKSVKGILCQRLFKKRIIYAFDKQNPGNKKLITAGQLETAKEKGYGISEKVEFITAYEYLEFTKDFKNLLQQMKDGYDTKKVDNFLKDNGKLNNSFSMNDNLIELMTQGKLTKDESMKLSYDIDGLQKMINESDL